MAIEDRRGCQSTKAGLFQEMSIAKVRYYRLYSHEFSQMWYLKLTIPEPEVYAVKINRVRLWSIDCLEICFYYKLLAKLLLALFYDENR